MTQHDTTRLNQHQYVTVFETPADNMQAQSKPWHRALLTKFGLTLEHRLRNGPMPQKLLMTASVLGLPTAALKGLTQQQLQQSVTTADHQQAQLSVVTPIVQDLIQSCKQNLVKCSHMQAPVSDNMLQCVKVYLEGQLMVLQTVLLELNNWGDSVQG